MNLNTINMDDILNRFRRRTGDNIRLLEERKEEIEARIPEVMEIDGKIRSISLDAAKKRLDDPAGAPSREDIRKETEKLIAEKRKLLTDNGYPEDYLDIIYTCKECQDTGYVDGTMCSCLKKMVVEELYKSSNLMGILSVENFDNFSYDFYSKEIPEGEKKSPYDNIVDIRKKAEDFVENFDRRPPGLLFTGGYGLGKTYLSNCIAKALLDKGYGVMYVTAIELFDICSDYMRNRTDASVSKMYKLLYDSELLIIDDLGTETINSFVQGQFFEVINQRLLRKRPTVISTNLSISNLSDRFAERSVSRIISNYVWCRFYGDNIRYTKISSKN